MRFEYEEGRRSLGCVADLCVFEDGYAEEILGGEVGEFNIEFRGGIEQASKLKRPHAISPFPTSGDIAAIADNFGFDDAGDDGTNGHGVQRSLVKGNLFAGEDIAREAGG